MIGQKKDNLPVGTGDTVEKVTKKDNRARWDGKLSRVSTVTTIA
ncbi:hypothetical protein [Neobacillus drentensis]|nr:hypothetical protein [Neobacillus drentensis]